jgi:PAS domain S-box-containing protein
MQEIAKITLENEMDLILAYKRSMKLAELAGLSLSAQTTFATAVSEVSRNPIETGKKGCLILSVDYDKREKYIVACLQEQQMPNQKPQEGLEYAKRLVNKYNVFTKGTESSIELFYYISPPFRIDLGKLDEWRSIFRNEPPLSPYEEIKRKNEILLELAETVQKSETQYKTVTNSLPLIIFSLDNEGQILYANQWLQQYTGETIESLNQAKWKSVVHEEDYDAFALLLKADVTKEFTAVKTQTRLRNKESKEYLWHQVSLSPFKDEKGELQSWTGYIVDIHAQKVIKETLQDNQDLKETQKQLKGNQETLEGYIRELNRSNQELQQFAFVASHDLQEPVRKLLFYSDYLLHQNASTLDKKSEEFLQNMQSASYRMRTLIQDLLTFSQINKQVVELKPVDLNQVAKEATQDLEMALEEKKAKLHIAVLPSVEGDAGMMRQLFENIIGNSVKYATPGISPVIDISYAINNDSHIIAFKDNGIGFDEKYLPQMFTLFQRLHDKKNYEGTGLGLAICRKIVDIHRGKIWAEAKEGEGATFYVSLPINASVE